MSDPETALPRLLVIWGRWSAPAEGRFQLLDPAGGEVWLDADSGRWPAWVSDLSEGERAQMQCRADHYRRAAVPV